MRATDRELKRKNKENQDRCKKIDVSENCDVHELIEQHKKVEKKLFPLRIDHRTVVYVTKEKCNKEYADKVRIRMGMKVKNIISLNKENG